MGRDSEHSKPPRGLGALLLRYLPESVEKELALTCMDSEARINYPFHIASPKVLPKATGSRCGWSDRRWAFAPHKEEYPNSENCLKMKWAALGRPCPSWRVMVAALLGSYKEICTRKRGSLQDRRDFPISRRQWSREIPPPRERGCLRSRTLG